MNGIQLASWIFPAIADFCRQSRDFSLDLHGCPQSLKAQQYVQGLISSMAAMQTRPGQRALSSNDMKLKEDRRHEMATAIKLNGGGVTPAYE